MPMKLYEAKLLGTICTNILKTGRAVELVPWLGALPSPMGDFSTPMEHLISSTSSSFSRYSALFWPLKVLHEHGLHIH